MKYSVKQFFDDMEAEIRADRTQGPPLAPQLLEKYELICGKYRSYIEHNKQLRNSVIQLVLNAIRGIDESSEDVVELAQDPKRSFLCCCCCSFFSRSHHSQEEVPILETRSELSSELETLAQCFVALQKNDLAKVEKHFSEIRTVQRVSQTRRSSGRRNRNAVIPAAEPPMPKEQPESQPLLKPQGPAPVPSEEQMRARSQSVVKGSGPKMPQRPAPVPSATN